MSTIRISTVSQDFDNPAKHIVTYEKIEAWIVDVTLEEGGFWGEISSAVTEAEVHLKIGEPARVTLDCFTAGDAITGLEPTEDTLGSLQGWLDQYDEVAANVRAFLEQK